MAAKNKKRIYFTIDCPNIGYRTSLIEQAEVDFGMKVLQVGSGFYNHEQADYYVYSQEKVRAVRKWLRKEFPKAKMITQYSKYNR